MLITRTPFRISFIGGGSDLPEFFLREQGAVLSTTINKYVYLSSHKYFHPHQLRLKYSTTETVTSKDEIQHPILRETLRKFDISGVEISSTADIPSGTGLGSSSAFTVGLLHNIYARQGILAGKHRLAAEACDIEINRLKEPIGLQDQYATAFGGLNTITFDPSGEVKVDRVHLKRATSELLSKRLLMFYTGTQRSAGEILREQKSNTLSPEKFQALSKMVRLVGDARDALYDEDLQRFGELLHANWLLKRKLASQITNSRIDDLYERGLRAGAVGGKLLGAGGSGFLLFYCDEQRQESLRAALSDLHEMQFGFDHEGSKVIYVEEESQEHLRPLDPKQLRAERQDRA